MSRIDEELLPNVFFKDGNGKTVDLASLKGKVVFVNFWATWCPPRIAVMPSINTRNKIFENNEDVVFLMVDADGNYEKSYNFMKMHQYNLKVVSPARRIPSIFMDETVPTTRHLRQKLISIHSSIEVLTRPFTYLTARKRYYGIVPKT